MANHKSSLKRIRQEEKRLSLIHIYSKEEGDFHAENIRIGNGEIFSA